MHSTGPVCRWTPPGWLVSRFDALAIASRKASPRYTERLHQLGKPVDLWMGQNEELHQEIGSQADFITTNHPRELRQALKQQHP